MTGTKLPYLRVVCDRVGRGSRLLDYGCGIGSDGLYLIEAGYDVAFADFDNPSTRYLRWRLAERGLEAEVYDLDRRLPPDGFDLAYAFDVIEHVQDPLAFVAELERCGELVLVNLLEPEASGTALHRDLPIDDIVARAARRRLLHYRRYHRRSHLLLYGRERPGPAARVASRARRLRGRLGP